MKDNSMTQEESLEIITKMIHTARGNFKGASFYFLFWGWIVVLGNLGQYSLAYFLEYEQSYMVWLITIPAGIISFWYGARMRRKSRVHTISDSIIFSTWMAYIPCLLIVIFFGAYFNWQITALIMMITGFATYVTGSAISFTPLKAGSFLFWVLTPVSLMLPMEWSPLIMTVAIIGGYLIPGYMLKNSK